MKISTAEHRRLVQDAERAKARASALEFAIRRHMRDVRGPGPVDRFGDADDRLYAALDRTPRAGRRAA